jgi:hypothetical protein
LPVILFSASQETSATGIRDRGEVFDQQAKLRAQEVLRHVQNRHHTHVLIETIPSLDGAWIADVAQQRAKLTGDGRFYVLIAPAERDVGVVGARHGPAHRFTARQREAIRRAFLKPLRAGKPNEALDQGVRAIEATLDNPMARLSSDLRDLLISATILLSGLAALLAWQLWAKFRQHKVVAEILT